MTSFEPRTRRKFLRASAVLSVMALSAAVAGCASPGSPKQIALAANTPARARASAAIEQRRQDLSRDYITLAPSRSVPIPGAGPNPMGLGPPQAFPDPYRDPQ